MLSISLVKIITLTKLYVHHLTYISLLECHESAILDVASKYELSGCSIVQGDVQNIACVQVARYSRNMSTT